MPYTLVGSMASGMLYPWIVGHRTPPTKFPSWLDDCSNSVMVIVIWLHRAGCFKNLLDGMFVASCWFAINAILLSELAQKLAC